MTNEEYMKIAKMIYERYKEQFKNENIDSILGNIVTNKPIISDSDKEHGKDDESEDNKDNDNKDDNISDGKDNEKEDDVVDKDKTEEDDSNKEDNEDKENNIGDEDNKDDGENKDDEENKDNDDNQDDEIIDNEARIKISEDGTDWNELKELRIFYNEFYEDEPKIAPGVSGEYKYTVENNWDKDVIYHMNFSEENPLNINMVYKLKDDGKYVFGDENTWVSHDDLNKPDIVIESGETHIYTLEEGVAKLNFIRKYDKNLNVILVPKNISKSKIVDTKNAILIDDYNENIKDWITNGGIGIKFNNKNYLTINSLNDICNYVKLWE